MFFSQKFISGEVIKRILVDNSNIFYYYAKEAAGIDIPSLFENSVHD